MSLVIEQNRYTEAYQPVSPNGSIQTVIPPKDRQQFFIPVIKYPTNETKDFEKLQKEVNQPDKLNDSQRLKLLLKNKMKKK